MKYSCGEKLDWCRCRYGQVTIRRTPTEIQTAHQAAVARARRSGFAREPLPPWLWQTYDPTAFTGLTGRRAA